MPASATETNLTIGLITALLVLQSSRLGAAGAPARPRRLAKHYAPVGFPATWLGHDQGNNERPR
jgi:hypothetical protein